MFTEITLKTKGHSGGSFMPHLSYGQGAYDIQLTDSELKQIQQYIQTHVGLVEAVPGVLYYHNQELFQKPS